MAGDYDWRSNAPMPAGEELSIEERLIHLRDFKVWIENFELKIDSTRLSQYMNFFEQWSADQDFFSQRENLDDALFFTREVDELLWIWSGLKQQIPPGALPKLKIVLGGNAYARNEHGNTVARNYGFEFRIGAYFIKAGYNVDMSQPSDLVVALPDNTLHVECKRLDSERKVEVRIKELAKQLKVRCKTHVMGNKTFGMAVLEVSRIINPNQGLSYAPDLITSRDGLRAQLVAFVRRYDPEQYFLHDKRVVSVWVQAMAPVLHPHQIHTRTTSTHIRCGLPTSDRGRLFDDLKPVFEVVTFQL